MKRLGLFLILMSFMLVHGCATPKPFKPQTLYQSWDLTLNRGNLKTVDDVSMVLGSTPTKCEEVLPSRIGGALGFGMGGQDYPNSTYISYIKPYSPAALAKMFVGEYIQFVNDIKTETAGDVMNALSLDSYETPVSIKTKKNLYTLVYPQAKEVKQCYWEISGGQVGRSSGGALMLPQVASSNNAAFVNQRFFRTVCRTYDGILIGCKSNWQE